MSAQVYICETFRGQAMKTPNALAVKESHFVISYAELNKKSEIVAQQLRKQGLKPLEPVCICLSPGINQIICQIAILLAKGVCFPIDQSVPDLRLGNLVHRACVRYILSDGGQNYIGTSLHSFNAFDGKSCIGLYRTLDFSKSGRSLDSRVTHLLHTSGSTGEPKLVQIAGSAIINLATNTEVTPLCPKDNILCLNNPSFDLAIFEIWVPLLSGASITVVARDILLDPPKFASFIRQNKANVALLSTGHFNLIAKICPDAFATLRILLTAGSEANASVMMKVLKNGPPEQLYNAYGPTEATIFATLYRVSMDDAEHSRVAIGNAVGNARVILLDKSGQLITAPEVLGEICIGGIGLSPGYLDGPEENNPRFVDISSIVTPEDEQDSNRFFKTGDLGYYRHSNSVGLVYAGRLDRQVKHNGYRVELGEVETIMKRSSLVDDAHTLHIRNPQDQAQKLLVACVVPRKDISSVLGLKAFCQKYLPPYMIPAHILPIESVPLNSRGKIDYDALTARINQSLEVPQHHDDKRATDPLEIIWKTILGLAYLSENDDFFQLGATSLQAAQLAVKIKEVFCRSVTIKSLYEHSQFVDMSRYIRSRELAETNDYRDLTQRMKADAHLADYITLAPGPVREWTKVGEGRPLLTGATGSVGAFFLKYFLSQEAMPNSIVCLVRSKGGMTPENRLRKALDKFELWEAEFGPRIEVVNGDIATQNFGLSDKEYEYLARTTSTVFHFAAHVNFCQRYHEHFDANVLGTKHVLQFAGAVRPKSVHYTSTIDAWGATGLVYGTQTLREDEDLEPHIQGPLYDTGYSQSQWVAEEMVRRARNRGFQVAIYRLGTVICDNQRCIGNPNDFFARVMVGCAQLGLFPIIEDLRWEYVTVDYVCEAVYHISRNQSNLGRSYSVVAPERGLSVNLERTRELLVEAGYSAEPVPYKKWVESLYKSEKLHQSPLLALMPLISEPVLGNLTRVQTSKNTPLYRTDNTKEAYPLTAKFNIIR